MHPIYPNAGTYWEILRNTGQSNKLPITNVIIQDAYVVPFRKSFPIRNTHIAHTIINMTIPKISFKKNTPFPVIIIKPALASAGIVAVDT